MNNINKPFVAETGRGEGNGDAGTALGFPGRASGRGDLGTASGRGGPGPERGGGGSIF